MHNLKNIKYDNAYFSFKQSIFYSSLYNPYYILHKDYLGAYLRVTNQQTTIDYKNTINIEINKELHYQKNNNIIYLPFQWEEISLILWTL